MPDMTQDKSPTSRSCRADPYGRDVHTEGVTGSIPVAPTIISNTYVESASGAEGSRNLSAAETYRQFAEETNRLRDSDIAWRLWLEREEIFPPRLRRNPDRMDEITGAWKIFRDASEASAPLQLGGRA